VSPILTKGGVTTLGDGQLFNELTLPELCIVNLEIFFDSKVELLKLKLKSVLEATVLESKVGRDVPQG
jgi:hypothetical protein